MSHTIPPDRLFRTIIPPVMLPIVLGAGDGMVVATALPAIAATFGEVERLSWVIVVNLIASTVAAPAYGRLADIFGRRSMLMVAMSVFLLAAIGCYLAPTFNLLLAARVMQGLGGGGLMTLAQALVGQHVPARERGSYQGYLSAGIVAGTTIGPVAGGFVTQAFGWHAVFLAYLPLGGIALMLALRLPPDPPATSRARFDLVGLALMAGFVVPFLMLVVQLQRFDVVLLPRLGGLSAVAMLALAALIWQQKRTPSPLLPIHLIRLPAVWRSAVMAACSGASLAALSTFLPLYFQAVLGASPGQAGMLLIPLTAAVSSGSVVTGWLITRTGRTAIFPAVGLMITAVTLAGLAVVSPWLSQGELAAILAVGGLCQGSAMLTAQLTVQIASSGQHLGSSAAMVQLSRSVGSAFGAASAGAVLFGTLAVTDPDTAAFFSEMVRRGPAILMSLPLDHAVVIQHQVANAFRGVFLTVACFSCTIVAMAATMPIRRV